MNSLIKSILLIIFSLGLSFSQQSVMDDEGFYLMCEKMPELIGGMDGLQRKIKYLTPDSADSIEFLLIEATT